MGDFSYIHMLTNHASNKYTYLDKDLLIVCTTQGSKLHTINPDLFNPIGL